MPTGPGSFDAQGVWQYGESDENPLGSDLLNRGMKSVSNQLALVRADLLDLQDPPDTDWRVVLPKTTSVVPDGEAKLLGTWEQDSSARFEKLSFRVRDGHVYISGAAKRAGTAPANDPIFQLPPGMRPSRSLPVVGTIYTSNTIIYADTGGYVRVDSTIAGTVIFSLQFPAALV